MNLLAAALVLARAATLGGGDLRTASGEPFSLSELLSRGPVVLVLWNSWLPESAAFAKLIPEVEAAAKRQKWPGAVVVFQEKNADSARSLLPAQGTLPVVFDRRGELVRRFKVTRAPAILLVERNGDVRSRCGPDPASVRALLEEMAHR